MRVRDFGILLLAPLLFAGCGEDDGIPVDPGDPTPDLDPDFLTDVATLAVAIHGAYSAGGTDLEDIADEIAASFATLVLLSEETRDRADKTLVNPPGGLNGNDPDYYHEGPMCARSTRTKSCTTTWTRCRRATSGPRSRAPGARG